MKLVLTRTYHPNGTNGVLTHNGKAICATIELPWRNNEHGLSCIRPGEYLLVKRYSQKFKEHLLLTGVENRDLILVHPANNAEKELRGCIAPVSFITGQGKGFASRRAFNKVMQLFNSSAQQKETVTLVIVGEPVAYSITLQFSLMKKVVTRMQRDTPSFFKKLRNIGLGLAAVATTILAGPVALPAIIVKIAGYLAVAGGVATAVSQAAVKNDE